MVLAQRAIKFHRGMEEEEARSLASFCMCTYWSNEAAENSSSKAKHIASLVGGFKGGLPEPNVVDCRCVFRSNGLTTSFKLINVRYL